MPALAESIAPVRAMGPGIAAASLFAGAVPLCAEERDPAVTIEAGYTADVIANVSGGARRGTRHLDNLDLVAALDLEQIAGLTGTTVQVSALYNNGTAFSALAGDAQVVSNIETGVEALRLYEAWIEKELGEKASLRVGLYDLNSEFDALDSAGLFVNSAHGIGTDIAQGGRNGPSIFPVTALAARLAVEPAEGWALRFAVLDGVPGDPERPARTSISLGNGDGALIVAEGEAPLGNGKLLFGHWRYTARQERSDATRSERGSEGFYLRGETMLAREADDPEQGLSGFLRIGTADDDFVPFSYFLGGGLAYTGPFAGRDEDQVGVALAVAVTGDDYRGASGSRADEIAIEFSYRASITDWLALQPNLHYIANPQGEPGVADAFVIGIRTAISFPLLHE